MGSPSSVLCDSAQRFAFFVAVMFRLFSCSAVVAPFATSHGIGPTMDDVLALAKGADAAADIYVEAAKLAPSLSDRILELDARDAAAVNALQAVASQQEREQSGEAMSAGGRCPFCARTYDTLCPEAWVNVGGSVCEAPATYDGACPAYGSFSEMSTADKREFERRCAACWPCTSRDAVAGFLQLARADAVGAATVRLVEADDAASSAARDLELALFDALEAVEARQRIDEAAYANLLASSKALAQATRAGGAPGSS